MKSPVLVVGAGLLGAALSKRLESDGRTSVFVSRSQSSSGLRPVDFTSRTAQRDFAEVIDRVQPSVVVLAHGPARVGICEDDPASAITAHVSPAEACQKSGVPTLLISTDAVFPGTHPHSINDAPNPMNAYGKAKLRAEEILSTWDRAVILRLSLLYNDIELTGPGDFFGNAIASLAAGDEVEAPIDQIVSPLYVGDAVEAIERLITAELQDMPSLVHLAGPELMSRHQLVVEAATASGFDVNLIRPVKRADSIWMSRPPFSCLEPNTREVSALNDWVAQSPRQIFEKR